MVDLFRNIMYAGAGLAFMTKEKAEEIGKDLVKRGKVSEEEAKAFIKDLSNKSREAKAKIETQVENIVKATLKKMNLITMDEFAKLENRLKALEKKVKAQAG